MGTVRRPMLFFNEKGVLTESTDETVILGVTVETVVQAAVILLVGVAIFVANVLVLAGLLTSPSRDPMTYYLISLAVTDLLCGVFVVPLSVYPALVQEWMYGDTVCRLEGYLEVTLWTVTIYTLMWIGVDRYVAVRKPLRYDTLQTRTRCQCWMLFSWVTAALLCSPPLLGNAEQAFSRDSCICMLDWSLMVPYGVTLAFLVLGPSLLTIVYTYSYVFRTIRRARRNRRRISLMHDMRSSASAAGVRAGAAGAGENKETALQSETLGNPHNGVAFALLTLFWLSWTPLVALHFYEKVIVGDERPLDVPMLRFFFTWLGILNCFWKAVVYILLSAQFRASLRSLVDTVCCCRCRCRRDVDKGRRRQLTTAGHDLSDASSTFDGLR